MLSVVLIYLTKTVVKIQVISNLLFSPPCVIHVWMWIARNLKLILYYFQQDLRCSLRGSTITSQVFYVVPSNLIFFLEIITHIDIWGIFYICSLKIIWDYICFLYLITSFVQDLNFMKCFLPLFIVYFPLSFQKSSVNSELLCSAAFSIIVLRSSKFAIIDYIVSRFLKATQTC